MFRAQKQAKKQCSEQSIEAVFRARKKMVQLGTWGYGLCSQYMCVPSCRDNRKLGTCLICLVNLKLGTLVPISSVQAIQFGVGSSFLGSFLLTLGCSCIIGDLTQQTETNAENQIFATQIN